MIYAELGGGLGNQMFVYAFARALALRSGEGMTLIDREDWRSGSPAHTACALRALPLNPAVCILADAAFAKKHLPVQNTAKALMIKYEQRKGLMACDWQPFEARCAPVLNALGLHFATDGYTPVKRGRAKDFLAWGYFQSERYFADAADTVRRELCPPAPQGDAADKIRAAQYPIAVHMRRGDYAKSENAILQVCTPVYYARAAASAAQAHPEATLFVFSDEPEWARENLQTAGLPAVYLPRGDAAADLGLMRLCRAFIISNSTYSWWAQYLSADSDAPVWAPGKWYAHTKKSALPQEKWRLIPTE